MERYYTKRGGIQGVVQVKVGMPKFGSVRFFQNFAERGTGLYVRSGKFAEPRTGPSVQVPEGPVQVQRGFERGTEPF